MEASILYNREEIISEIPFMVIVENWEKKLDGKVKREFYEQFTAKERQTLATYISRFRKWALKDGVPESCNFAAKNIDILRRGGVFFGSC